MKKLFLTILLVLVLGLSACGAETPVEPAPAAPEEMPADMEEATAEPAAPTDAPEPTSETAAEFKPQPADGQRVEFQAEDGTKLVGYYYPAGVPDAPVVVLMHWARGDQNDWLKNGMVDWLQNRGTQHGTNAPARQSVIYPVMPENVSFAVFTFDFREYGESEGSFSPDGLVMDAKAAYEKAKTLEGVDPTRLGGIGSSIGADGVVDGCADGCLGTLSLSPGSYLNVPYTNAVKLLDDEEKPVTCVASEGDITSANTCKAAAGNFYEAILYTGSEHGDMFYQNPPEGFGEMLYDWLDKVFQIEG